MLKTNLRKHVTGSFFTYRYEFQPGEPHFDEVITRAELEAQNAWARFVWPDPANPPAEIKPGVEYKVTNETTSVQLATVCKLILGPRYQSAIGAENTRIETLEVSLR
jgi:hypothetical protein